MRRDTGATPCDFCTIIVRYIASIVCLMRQCQAKKSSEIFATFSANVNGKFVTKNACYIGVFPPSEGPPVAPKGVRIFVKKTEGGGRGQALSVAAVLLAKRHFKPMLPN